MGMEWRCGLQVRGGDRACRMVRRHMGLRRVSTRYSQCLQGQDGDRLECVCGRNIEG